MQIRTELYEAAHGKKPRGYGAWAFKFYLKVMPGETETHFVTGNFSDASKKASEIAELIGAYKIQVGS